MGYKPLEQFNWGILLVKFLKVLLPAEAAAIVIEQGIPTSVGEFLSWGDANIAAFISALIVAALNIYKHRAKLDAIGLKSWTILFAAALSMTGCMSLAPAVGGKTHARTEFIDADGTSYTREVHLPAGVDLAGADSMTYTWDGEGAGGIAINGDSTASTQGQAAMLPQVAAIQAQTIADAMAALNNALAIIGPLVGAHIDRPAPPAEPNPLLDAVVRGALRPR